MVSKNVGIEQYQVSFSNGLGEMGLGELGLGELGLGEMGGHREKNSCGIARFPCGSMGFLSTLAHGNHNYDDN